MKNLKTVEKIKQVKSIIDNRFKGEITLSELIPMLKRIGIHEMNFYYLFYSGCVERTGKGAYVKTIRYNTITPEEAYKKTQVVLERMRDRKRAEKARKNNIEAVVMPHSTIDISQCISVLKNAGYRIYKPINQYEEI